MRWLIRIYAFILLGYAGWRTYDFLLHSLPAGETGYLLALLFLFATEAGLILWHEVSIRHTSTQEQHYIATALTWVDFAGSLSAGTADMILRQTFVQGYTIPSILVTVLIYGLPLVVALNVAGVLIYLANDNELQIDRAKRELKFEITRQALRELADNKSAIAEQMKSGIYQRLKADVTGKYPRSSPMPEMPVGPSSLQGPINPAMQNQIDGNRLLPTNGNKPELPVNPTMPSKRGRPPIKKH